MLGASLRYPTSGPDWVKTILIGGVLSLLGAIVVLPLLPVEGYFARVLRSAAQDESEAPVFEEWGRLFIDGIKMFVIQIIYIAVPFILLAIAIVGIAGGLLTEGNAASTVLVVLGVLFVLVALLLSILALYMLPAALANFAYRDKFGAAFDLGTIRRAAFSSDYFVALLLALVVGIVLGTIAAILSLLIIGIFLVFYVQVSVYYLFGRGYARGLGLGTTDREEGTLGSPLPGSRTEE